MTNDHWVTAALTNDTLVAELLHCLKQSTSSDSSSHRPSPPSLIWGGFGHRQRRSKPNNNKSPGKERGESTRCSPTTPLSWSGDAAAYASTSDGSDPSSGGRSKATFANESATTASPKKQRKRKSFSELKEEEGFLLKERIHLKRELASMQVTFKEQMARSENLKRIKLDLHRQPENKMGQTYDKPLVDKRYQFNQIETASTADQTHLILPSYFVHDNSRSLDSCKVQNNGEIQERGFVLPDLNMTPAEEESGMC